MAFKLPPDIEEDLQKRFPDIHVPTFVDALFQSILSKITKHSVCTIREFGKFTAFVTHSRKMAKNTIRFKFRVSTALNNKIKSDQYLLNKLPIKATKAFSEENEKKVKDKQAQKLANVKASTDATSYSKRKTDEEVVANEIARIVGDK